jgi:hypothetical protein
MLARHSLAIILLSLPFRDRFPPILSHFSAFKFSSTFSLRDDPSLAPFRVFLGLNLYSRSSRKPTDGSPWASDARAVGPAVKRSCFSARAPQAGIPPLTGPGELSRLRVRSTQLSIGARVPTNVETPLTPG